MKLGRATVMALVFPPVFASLGLMLGAISSLVQYENLATKIVAFTSGLLLFSAIYRFLAHRRPDIFSEDVDLRGPQLTLPRASVLVVVMLVWAAIFIWTLGSKQLAVLRLSMWQMLILGTTWYIVLVAVIHLLELTWLKRDCNDSNGQ